MRAYCIMLNCDDDERAYVTDVSFLHEADNTKDEQNDLNENYHGQISIHHVLHPIRLQIHISPVANHQYNLSIGTCVQSVIVLVQLTELIL